MLLRVQSFVDRSSLISLMQIEQITGIPRPTLERLLEEEIVHAAITESGERMFTADDVRVIERCIRLHDDLGVNWPGIGIIEQLLQRLSEGERRDDNNAPTIDVLL